ncbi:MAG: carbon monoxide dehydrogenase [Sulfobacillus thermosulfidooxidans]|nr:carbon monoxide dehydrogenase [Sulfobacillus sp. hq2]PSR38003.1 MAG: carbon monoxide dehydrogenase [Sulfobacillus thermosulfidooxidans]
MKIDGHKRLGVSPEMAYRLFMDPAVLVRTMPGLKALEPLEEGVYAAEMEIGVASIKGKYQGRMEIRDPIKAQSYRLVMTGQGPGGFVEVHMDVVFSSQDQAALVTYQGEAQVGGPIAQVGQRMLSGVATYIVNQFFSAMAKEAALQAKEA